MPLPAGVTTFSLSFDVTDLQGVATLVGKTGKLTAVDPSSNRRINLTHVATGRQLLPDPVDFTIAADGTASVTGLPHTGQAGITPTGYAYRVEWDIPSGPRSVSPGNLTFVVPAPVITQKFGDLQPAATLPVVAISQPVIQSVNGKTGAAVVLNATDVGAVASVAGLTGSPTASALADELDDPLGTKIGAAGNPLGDAARAAYASRAQITRTLPGRVATDRNSTATVDAAGTVGTARLKHTARVAARDVRLVFAHYELANGGDSSPAGAITFRCAVEIGGVVVPLTARGQRLITLDEGLVVTDPVGLDLVPGDIIHSRVYLASGTPRANHVTDPAAGEGLVATSDLTAAGAGAVATSFNFCFGPVAVIGGPDATIISQVSLGIVGDSIAYGQGDSMGAGRNAGFLIRAANAANLANIQVAVPGELLNSGNGILQTGAYRYRMPLLTDCTHVISQYLRNDCSQSRTTAEMQAAALTFWTRIAARGAKAYQTTITPKSTSTDAWATTGNQTTDATNAARVGFNDWLRGGAPVHPTTKAAVAVGTSGALLTGQAGHPLTGYFDPADAVESARNTGIWKAGHTGDGTHPNGTGHTAMATAVNLSTLA